MLLNILKLFL